MDIFLVSDQRHTNKIVGKNAQTTENLYKSSISKENEEKKLSYCKNLRFLLSPFKTKHFLGNFLSFHGIKKTYDLIFVEFILNYFHFTNSQRTLIHFTFNTERINCATVWVQTVWVTTIVQVNECEFAIWNYRWCSKYS